MEKKKRNPKKTLVIVLLTLAILAIVWISTIMIIMKSGTKAKETAPGNAEEYSVKFVEPLTDSPLKGKNILFLGSSVTYGDASQGESFVEYLEKLDGINATKNAVSATTLIDEFSFFAKLGHGDGRSYATRLLAEDTEANFDAVVVQLSTNDATMKKNLGEVSTSMVKEDFNTKTITGAMEYIIAYCKDTWNCPVIFYTGSYYDSEEYSAMVDRLLELQQKWEIGVIDLYTDKEFNNIDTDTYDFYMYDKIHPTKAGYLLWWTPSIEAYLCDYLAS